MVNALGRELARGLGCLLVLAVAGGVALALAGVWLWSHLSIAVSWR
jgi:hypothetical protein